MRNCASDSAAKAKNFFVFLGVADGAIERSCYSPHYLNTERDYERETTRQFCLRATQQQTGSSPVTAVTIGSGSAALVG